MYPIRKFKCFLIIVLCTFTALQSIPSAISSFIGCLKYWSLTDKSKHHNLTLVSWWWSKRAVGGIIHQGSPPHPLLFYCFYLSTFAYCSGKVYVKHLHTDGWLIWPFLPVPLPPHTKSRLVSSFSINTPMTFCKMQRRGFWGAFVDCCCLNCCHCCQDNSDLSP